MTEMRCSERASRHGSRRKLRPPPSVREGNWTASIPEVDETCEREAEKAPGSRQLGQSLSFREGNNQAHEASKNELPIGRGYDTHREPLRAYRFRLPSGFRRAGPKFLLRFLF